MVVTQEPLDPDQSSLQGMSASFGVNATLDSDLNETREPPVHLNVRPSVQSLNVKINVHQRLSSGWSERMWCGACWVVNKACR